MTKISNYNELVAERRRIEQELAIQKEQIHEEVRAIKESLRPLTSVLSFFGNVKNQSFKTTALQIGAHVGIDVLLRNTILGKAGWLTKLIVPFLAKKISSSVIQKATN